MMDATQAERGANWVGMDGIEIINSTELNTEDVLRELRHAPEMAALTRWAQGISSPHTREGGLFDRDKFVTPFNIYDQMSVAYQAAESDDIVSGVLESTEALAFGGMSIDAEDIDQEDIWNQIMEDIDLESRIREMWRELFIVSQAYVCTWWQKKSYKVRGRGKSGVQRKKTFDLTVPAGMTLLDPMKVLPVGNLMFNQEQLVYIAVPGECVAAGTQVWTVNGVRKIEDIRIGEIVLALKDGELVQRPVVNTFQNKVKPIRKIQTYNHTLRVSPDHPVLCLRKRPGHTHKGNPQEYWTEWTKAEHLTLGDVVVGLQSLPEEMQGKEPEPTVEHAYILGLLSGDGGADKRFNVRSRKGVFASFTLHPGKDEVDDWEQLLQAQGWSVTRNPKENGNCSLYFPAPELASWGEFMRTKCTERLLPDWVFRASFPVREAFLRGFIEADGNHKGATALEWNIHNRQMSEQVRALAMSLGWSCGRVRPKPSPAKYINGAWTSESVGWRCEVRPSTKNRQIPFRFDPQNKVDLNRNLLARAIISIEDEPAEPVYDIEVEDAHNFIADGLVVHNSQQFERILSEGLSDDTIVSQLVTGRYQPSYHERVRITQLGLPADHLYFLNPKYVWRHTLTRPQYIRFSPIRLRSVFELLDMKHQLRQADRAHLIGASNWILLVKKGTDALPSTTAEVQALASSVRTVSKVPIIVGDHRLTVEIVTPKTDYVLNDEKWSVLDSRIASRLYQMFTVGSSTREGSRDDSLKLARVVARGMESRRHMMRRALEKNIFEKVFEMNDSLTDVPKLNFHPRTISLDFDPAVATLLQDLRDRGDLSRETYLEQIDLDQVTEARNREREIKMFDKTFETQNPWGGTPSGGPRGQQAIPRPGTQLAGGAPLKPGTGQPQSGQLLRPGMANPTGTGSVKPGAQNPKTSGRAQGGRHNGGGAAGGQKGSGRSKTTQTKTTLRQASKADLDQEPDDQD